MSSNLPKEIKEVFKYYDLFSIVEIVPREVLKSRNKSKSWNYGYNEEFDIIIISKDGTIGDIYKIANLYIAIPSKPESDTIFGYELPKANQKWKRTALPKELERYNTMYGPDGYLESSPKEIKDKYHPYILEEFRRRKEGYWFYINGKAHYITGFHYMYLQWSPIDVGYADFWLSSMISYYHWEACVADKRSYGQIKVKARRTGWSEEASSDCIKVGSENENILVGIVSKTGEDAKSFFTSKLSPKFKRYPFFFKPLFEGSDDPKKEWSFKAPSGRSTRKNMGGGFSEFGNGLGSRINWKNTKDNSYDSEKLKLIIEDEFSKWEKPENFEKHWDVIKQSLRIGRKIIGKCKAGSTINPSNLGGAEGKSMYFKSDVSKRMKNGETESGLYSIFVSQYYNFEGFIDEYGYPVLENPTKPILGIDGENITQGVIEYFDNYANDLKHNQDALNEFFRKNPRTIDDAFREPSGNSPFNVNNIHSQILYNKEFVQAIKGQSANERHFFEVAQYSLEWKDGKRDCGEVIAVPNSNGRFYFSCLPPKELRNKIEKRNGQIYPGNMSMGALGCDPYDISTTSDGRGSNGSIHAVSRGKHVGFAEYGFFMEYVERPDVNVFFDDVIKACVFLGMQVLPERDKSRLLFEMKDRGYRNYIMNRPDKEYNELTGQDLELGGVPSRGEVLRNGQVEVLANYINFYVGESVIEEYRPLGEFGFMPFNRTLKDWEEFDPKDRTKSDATISSSLAMLAIQPKGFYAKKEKKVEKINMGFKTLSSWQN